MDLKKWKQLKRSGGFRRKVKSKYLELQKKSRSFLETHEQYSAGYGTSGSVQVFNEPKPVDNFIQEQPSPSSEVIKQCDDSSIGSVDLFFSSDNLPINSSDSEEEDHVTRTGVINDEFRDNIRNWAIKCNIPHADLRELFMILNERLPDALPKDPRTLLKTNKKQICIIPISSGYYWHNGLKKQLKKLLEVILEIPDKVSLNVNIDGLPIYKSSRHQLWPILCNVFEFPNISPLIVGIYEGQGKPSDLDAYLGPLVTELKEMESGLDITKFGDTIKVEIKIRAFICDSPARALIKGVANFNSKDGCLKCTINGEYSHESHTVTFPRTNCPKRNDRDFRLKKYGNHHKVDSPLLQLSIDVIEDIPVSDSLHLIDLGIMKRLLTGWRDGNFGKFTTKWSVRDIQKVSTFLSQCQLPSEIHRSVRTLEVLAHWKASEYRSFLFYLSFIILRHTLSSEAYDHFLSFYCAITICSSEKYIHFLRLAESLLKFFIEKYKDFYGIQYITSNVHNLCHLVDEVRRFGNLQTFNAYPFENKLYTIKNMLRQGHKPLQQVARRLNERSYIELESLSKQQSPVYPFLRKNRCITVLHFKTFMLSSQKQNKWFLSNEGHILGIKSIFTDKTTDNILLSAVRMQNICEAFERPIKSSFLNIFKCSCRDIAQSEIIYKVTDIQCKMVCIEYDTYFFFIPLVHTL